MLSANQHLLESIVSRILSSTLSLSPVIVTTWPQSMTEFSISVCVRATLTPSSFFAQCKCCAHLGTYGCLNWHIISVKMVHCVVLVQIYAMEFTPNNFRICAQRKCPEHFSGHFHWEQKLVVGFSYSKNIANFEVFL